MYTLRQVQDGLTEKNTFLGKSYRVIKRHNEKSDIPFDQTLFGKMINGINMHNATRVNQSAFSHISKEVPLGSEVYAFVVNESEDTFIPLLENDANYIMTESGATFSNISKKSGI